MLDRLGDAPRRQLDAKLDEARRERAQPRQLTATERHRVSEHRLVERGEPREPSIRDAAGEVLVGVSCLAALELGVARQTIEPRRRVAADAERLAGVAEQQPAALLVVCEQLRQSVGPAARERSRQAWLELLYRCACLEPGDATGDRHPQHRPPGPGEHELDRTRRLHVRTDPRLSDFARRQGARMPDLRTSMLQANRAACAPWPAVRAAKLGRTVALRLRP